MASGEIEDTLLPKFLALPIFASDLLSSVAYATEAGMVVLLAAGYGSLHLILPISIAIAALLGIVALSYTQTVKAYETSRGAYIVAKDNLGTLPSLVAGAALLTDYVLTVAVSVAAGILAITSAAPSLSGHKVALSLGCILVIMLVNLRGVRESGALFAFPTYAILVAMYRDDRGRALEGADRKHAPRGERQHTRGGNRIRGPPARPPRVRLGIGSVDRRRGGLERCLGLSPATVEERGEDADRHGGDRGLARARGLLPCRQDGGAPELDRLGALGDHPRDLPCR
jgi:hypothetical protein